MLLTTRMGKREGTGRFLTTRYGKRSDRFFFRAPDTRDQHLDWTRKDNENKPWSESDYLSRKNVAQNEKFNALPYEQNWYPKDFFNRRDDDNLKRINGVRY